MSRRSPLVSEANPIGWQNPLLAKAGWRYLDTGVTRSVFTKGPRLVLKVPLSRSGLRANVREYAQWQAFGRDGHPKGLKLARCKLLSNGWLLMVRLEPGCGGVRPDWVYNMPDGAQVGKDSRGNVLAYDYDDWQELGSPLT